MKVHSSMLVQMQTHINHARNKLDGSPIQSIHTNILRPGANFYARCPSIRNYGLTQSEKLDAPVRQREQTPADLTTQ